MSGTIADALVPSGGLSSAFMGQCGLCLLRMLWVLITVVLSVAGDVGRRAQLFTFSDC